MTAPFWGPFALLYGLSRICGDGLLFILEGYGLRPPLRKSLLRFLAYLLALPIFPVVITVETALSFLIFLGTAPLSRAGIDPVPRPLAAALGLPMLLLSPVWFPLLALCWLTAVLVPGLGQVTLLQMKSSGAALRPPELVSAGGLALGLVSGS
ncbi:MAG: hypothetical protein VX498_12075, partial [Myxococcota bacterium]|nr:hypothetical protein [Myxococcota bacterium]